MSIVAKITTSTFPLTSVDVRDLDLSDLYQQAIAIKRNVCPQWTDETASDFGNVLLWSFVVLIDWLKASLEQEKDNNFIGTTEDRESMRKLCELINYTLSEATAASVIATFTFEAGHPEFTLLKETQIETVATDKNDAIIFEVSEDTLILVSDDTKDINCIQGDTITNEIIGSSDGSTFQEFKLSLKPTIWESEVVEIFDGNSWVEWTRKTSFVLSNENAEDYSVSVGIDGFYTILFGDGVNGKIPVRGANNIRCTYRRGGGDTGNVSLNIITVLSKPIDYVESVTNANSATGGSNQESLAHARRFAPASLRTLDRLVTTEDVENFCNTYISQSYGGIAVSKAYSASSLSIRVMIVPHAGGLPPEGFRTEVQSQLNNRRMITTTIVVDNPNYIEIDVTADIVAIPNVSANVIAQSVLENLNKLLSANYQDPVDGIYPHEFGRNVYTSDLISAIDGSDGVDYLSLVLPAGNVNIEDYQISDLGTVILNIDTGLGDTQFTFVKGTV